MFNSNRANANKSLSVKKVPNDYLKFPPDIVDNI